MSSRGKTSAVRNLTSVYTVVIGVALSLAVAGVIDPQRGLLSVTQSSVLLFIAFVATLLPFVHGALMHLDVAYFDAAGGTRRGALVFDFILLFFHALAFVVLSLLMNNAGHFAWAITGVLVIDVFWGVFAHFSGQDKNGPSAPGRWATINAVFVLGAIAFLVANDIFLADPAHPTKIAVCVACGAVIRTIVDYLWCREFYFPETRKRQKLTGKE